MESSQWERDLIASGHYRPYTRKVAEYGSSDATTGKLPLPYSTSISIQGVANEISVQNFADEAGQLTKKNVKFTTLDGLAPEDKVYDEYGRVIGKVAGEPVETWENGGFCFRVAILYWDSMMK